MAVSDLEKGTADSQIYDAKDWASPADPGNAQNWPFLARVFPTALVGAIAFLWYVQNHSGNIPFIYATSIQEDLSSRCIHP